MTFFRSHEIENKILWTHSKRFDGTYCVRLFCSDGDFKGWVNKNFLHSKIVFFVSIWNNNIFGVDWQSPKFDLLLLFSMFQKRLVLKIWVSLEIKLSWKYCQKKLRICFKMILIAIVVFLASVYSLSHTDIIMECQTKFKPETICEHFQYGENCFPWDTSLCAKKITFNERNCPTYDCPVSSILKANIKL